MFRKLTVCAIALMAACSVAHGYGIQWAANNNWLNYSDGATPLAGDSSSSFGCFVQLIWVGANGTIDSAYDSGTGVGGSDDVVVDTRWVGAAVGGNDGYFAGGQISDGGNVVSGRVYYARIWTAPAANYASDLVPTSLTNFYGNSALFTYNKVSPTFDTFDITGSANVNATLPVNSAVPEPGIFALAVVGLISLRTMTRKKL